jgi:hypothetical protein
MYPPLDYTRSQANSVYRKIFRSCFDRLPPTRTPGSILLLGSYRWYIAHIVARLMKKLGRTEHLYVCGSFHDIPGSAHYHEDIRQELAAIIPADQITVGDISSDGTWFADGPSSHPALIFIEGLSEEAIQKRIEALAKHNVLQGRTILLLDDIRSNTTPPGTLDQRIVNFFEHSAFGYTHLTSYGRYGKVLCIWEKHHLFCSSMNYIHQFAPYYEQNLSNRPGITCSHLPISPEPRYQQAELSVYYDSSAAGDAPSTLEVYYDSSVPVDTPNPAGQDTMERLIHRLATVRSIYPHAEIRHLARLISHTMLHANKLVGVYGYPGSGNILFQNIIRNLLQLEIIHLPELHLHNLIGDYLNLQQSFFRYVGRTLRNNVETVEFVSGHFEKMAVHISYRTGHALELSPIPCHMALQAPVINSHDPREQDMQTMRQLGYRFFLIKRHPLETLLSTASKASGNKPEQALDNPDWIVPAANLLCSWYEQVLPSFHFFTVVAYEDLIHGPKYLRDFARQIGVNISDKDIDSIWQEYGFKSLVDAKDYQHFWKGGSGKWKTYFQPQHLKTLNDIGFFTLFPKLGYELPDQIEEVNPDRSLAHTDVDIRGKNRSLLIKTHFIPYQTELACGNKHTIHIYATHPDSLEEATRLAEDARKLLEQPGWNELVCMVAP